MDDHYGFLHDSNLAGSATAVVVKQIYLLISGQEPVSVSYQLYQSSLLIFIMSVTLMSDSSVHCTCRTLSNNNCFCYPASNKCKLAVIVN